MGPELPAVSGELGGLWARGTLLDSDQGHPGPQLDPGISCPETGVFWKERQEPSLGEGVLSAFGTAVSLVLPLDVMSLTCGLSFV